MSKTQRLEEKQVVMKLVCVYLCMQDGEGMEVCTCVGVCGMEDRSVGGKEVKELKREGWGDLQLALGLASE